MFEEVQIMISEFIVDFLRQTLLFSVVGFFHKRLIFRLQFSSDEAGRTRVFQAIINYSHLNENDRLSYQDIYKYASFVIVIKSRAYISFKISHFILYCSFSLLRTVLV